MTKMERYSNTFRVRCILANNLHSKVYEKIIFSFICVNKKVAG